MMRSLWHALEVLLLINALLVAGFLMWMWRSDRLNAERVQGIVDNLSVTVAQEKAAEEAKQAAMLEEQEKREVAARLASLSEGPRTILGRLASDQTADEISRLRIDRMREETQRLRDQMARMQRELEQRQAALDRQREAMDQLSKAQSSQLQSEDFRKAVDLLSRLEPAQSCDVLRTLLQQGRQQDVINFLSAMQPRKAAAVLEQFGALKDTATMTQLINELANGRAEAWTQKPQEPATP